MRDLYSFLGVGTIVVVVFALPACAMEAGTEESASAPTSKESNALGTNPKHDATYVTTIVPHGGPAGATFTDLAVNGTKYYLLRSDGYIERWNDLAIPSFESVYASQVWSAIKYVQPASGPTWGLIGAVPATRKFQKNIQNVASNFADWPSDATWVSEIAGVVIAKGLSLGLRLFIVRSNGPGGPGVVQYGEWFPTTGMTWFPFVDYGLYSTGLAYTGGKVYTVINYITGPFYALTPTSTGFTGTAEGLSPYTDHDYFDLARGYWDRFAPEGMDYNPADSTFYGIDDSVSGGIATQVIAKLPKSMLRSPLP